MSASESASREVVSLCRGSGASCLSGSPAILRQSPAARKRPLDLRAVPGHRRRKRRELAAVHSKKEMPSSVNLIIGALLDNQIRTSRLCRFGVRWLTPLSLAVA